MTPRRRRGALAAVAGVAVAAAAVVIGIHRPQPPGPVAVLSGPGGQATCSAAFSPSGTTLAVAGANGNIYLWDLATRRVAATVPASSDCGPECPVAFSPDGAMLAVGQSGGGSEHIYLWDITARRWAAAKRDCPAG